MSERLMVVRAARIVVAAALSLTSLTAFAPLVAARAINVEYLRAYDLNAARVCLLSGLATRNFGKIVHLDIAVTWSREKSVVETSGYQRLVIWDEHAEYLFQSGSYQYQHGSYVISGYFIPRSGGMHQGIVSLAFERVDDAHVLLNPNVIEIEVGTRACNDTQTARASNPQPHTAPTASPTSTISAARSVPMQIVGGTYAVPVLINNAITLDFVLDSGAADVVIPADVVLTLMRTGTLRPSDFLGSKTYVLADGSKVPSETFRIRSLKVGDIVLEDVTGSVADVKGSLLLGQSFLGRFRSWSIDNTTHSLLLQQMLSQDRQEASVPSVPIPKRPTFKPSASDEDALRRTIAPCWNIDPGQDYQAMAAVVLRLTLSADGTVMAADIQNRERYSSDSRYRTVADSVRRAALNPKCSKLPLPLDQYPSWQTLYVTFDPKEALR